MQLGAHVLRNALFAAPMAGVTDRPFRILARRYGAGLAISEMVTSRPELRGSRKSLLAKDPRDGPGRFCFSPMAFPTRISQQEPMSLDKP